VLREALNHRLPGNLIPKKKRGFNTPVAALLRTGLAPMAARLLDTEVERLSPLLRPEGVRALWAAHRSGAANHGYALWCLLTLAVWVESLECSMHTTPALSFAAS
jgi:asparagine synthase (glutamine-hydrolysing)